MTTPMCKTCWHRRPHKPQCTAKAGASRCLCRKPFEVGDRVRDRRSDRTGVVVRLSMVADVVRVRWDDLNETLPALVEFLQLDSLVERHRFFMKAALGLSAHQAGKIMSQEGTIGIDWCGTPKGRMADAYAAGEGLGVKVQERVIRALRTAERKD